MDEKFLLQDRIQKIQQIIRKYGEENFYLSFSGGKDSTVLSALVDMAIPGNKIPRVYANTGIELNMIRDFVIHKQETDSRIEIIKPTTPIKEMLERDGYPFKSKKHAKKLGTYQRHGMTQTAKAYLDPAPEFKSFGCPDILRYQFSPDFKLKVDYKCCINLKEKPVQQWAKEHGRPYGIVGIRKAEGGSRQSAHCLAFSKGKLKNFQPLVPVSDKWEEWFIKEYNIEICDIYKPPYNCLRTGCKGCPFAMKLQEELDMLEKYFPAERKQCEYIWKPVYEEYRRIGYRLRKDNYRQTTLDEMMNLFQSDGCAKMS
jgi:3'-phosphoadenosine 5'-phosphosulfate sulfotransferase (PAPS reductase)/FAD synthetase